MPKYDVTVREVYTYVVTVEVAEREQAIDAANELISQDDIPLEDMSYHHTEDIEIDDVHEHSEGVTSED